MGEMEKKHKLLYPFWKKQSFVCGYRMCNSFVIGPLQALYNISHCQIAVIYSPSFAGTLVNNIWCRYKNVSRNHNRKHFVLVLLKARLCQIDLCRLMSILLQNRLNKPWIALALPWTSLHPSLLTSTKFHLLLKNITS